GDWMPPAQVMADNDVLLLPSRFEGVPLVMLEAMALGLPVVASDLPGTRAYVPAEQLFPVGDLGRALRILLELTSRDLRERLARAGRLMYEQTASGKAFSAAVRGLTHDIRQAFPTEATSA
ncbi:MAG: glycosyltransferase family 1 protein, partial [Rhizobacter sp.]|nr:glycosyltransferase family 1 protein [Rhizobacter sp.]